MSRSFGGTSVTSRSPMRMRPVVDLFEAGEHAQGRGLAATGGADQNEELAVGDLEVELVDRGAGGARVEPGCLVESD